jgi:hypothetical protein
MSEVVVREAERLDVEQIKFIASTDFVPKQYRGKLAEIMACIAAGREIGLGDMESLRQISVIEGRPSLSAELMVKLVRRQGHSIMGQVGDGEVTVVGKRADNDDEMKVTWTLAMAERAGIGGKTNWQRYPEAMLWARAASQLCRMLFADCLAGMAHTPEELGADEPPFVEVSEPPVIDGPSEERVPEVIQGEQESIFEQMAQDSRKRKAAK